MGQGYTRNDTGNNIADGNIINAADLDGEFDAVEAAFNETTGHTHDGTAAEGAPITVLGPVQDFIASATEIKPKTTNTLDIGTNSLQFKDMYLEGTAYLDDIQAVGAVDITGDLDVDNININGNTISSTDTNGNINLVPNGTGEVNLTDNDKLTFGAGSDLQIYHDAASNATFIQESGTGNLIIDSSNLNMRNAAGTQSYLNATDGAEVTLRYAGSAKLSTTNTGVDVTGTVNITGDGDDLIVNSADYELVLLGNRGGTGVDLDKAFLRMKAQGTNTIVLDTAGNSYFNGGNVGIGTSSPGFKFQVQTDATTNVAMFDLIGVASVCGVTNAGGSAELRLAGQNLSFTGNGGAGAEHMRIDTSGNVGIGTSSPSESLTNRGNIFIETNSTSADSGNGLFWQSTTSGWTTSTAHAAIYGKRTDGSNGYLRFDTRQSGTTQEAMRIDSSGNLLHGKTVQSIGTVGVTLVNGQITATADGADAIRLNRKSSDGSIIDLRKDGTTVGSIGSEGSGSRLYIVQGDTGLGMQGDVDSIIPVSANGLSRGSAIDLGYSSIPFQDLYLSGNAYADNFIGTNDTNTFIAMTGSDLMRFYTGNSEHMRITSGGNVFFGCTAFPSASVAGFTINGTSSGNASSSGASTAAYNHLLFYNGNGIVGYISTSGSTTTYSTSSDYRLKTAVTYDWDATTRLKQLRPARFEWIADGDDAVPVDGFLAHEVQSVVPEAITGTHNGMRDEEYEVTPAVLDEDGNEVTPAVMGTRSVPDYQGIDQSKLVPLLVKTIQELEARITALEAN